MPKNFRVRANAQGLGNIDIERKNNDVEWYLIMLQKGWNSVRVGVGGTISAQQKKTGLPIKPRTGSPIKPQTGSPIKPGQDAYYTLDRNTIKLRTGSTIKPGQDVYYTSDRITY